MKNHRMMFKALLAGKILEHKTTKLALILDYNDMLATKNVTANNNSTNILLNTLFIPEEWEIQPEFININGYKVPLPIKEGELKEHDKYWYISTGSLMVIEIQYSSISPIDNAKIAAGLVHRTKEAAELHLKALLSFTNYN